MSEDYSEWTSSDSQFSSDYLVFQNRNDLVSLNPAQQEFVLRKELRTEKQKHIYRKLLYRIEKYWEFKQVYSNYTYAKIIGLLDSSFDTSIQYMDIYTTRRISTDVNAQPQMGTVNLIDIEADKLFMYDPFMKACRRPDRFYVELFGKILKSETTKVQHDTENGDVYLMMKYIWNSIPMFQMFVWKGEHTFRYHFFYTPIHNNPLLTSPLFSLKMTEDYPGVYFMYNNNGKLVQTLSVDLL